MTTALFIHLLAWGTAVFNIGFVVGAGAFLFGNGKFRAFIKKNARLVIFLLSAASIIATLTLEYVGGLPPCILCWWQRIFMYPVAIISGIAVIKDTDVSDIADYVLAFSLLGGAVALYQHLLQMLPAGSLIPCDAANECAVRSVFELGYITLPWMALSVFAILVLVAFVARPVRARR